VANVVAKENESLDSLLRRFNKKVMEGNILREARRHERYEKPSVKRRRKAAEALKKAAKARRRTRVSSR